MAFGMRVSVLFDTKTICGTSRAHLLFLDALFFIFSFHFLWLHSFQFPFTNRLCVYASWFCFLVRGMEHFFVNRSLEFSCWLSTEWMIYYHEYVWKTNGNAKWHRLIGWGPSDWNVKRWIICMHKTCIHQDEVARLAHTSWLKKPMRMRNQNTTVDLMFRSKNKSIFC